MPNIRFHAIALSVLTLLVIVIFYATGQFSEKSAAPAKPTGPGDRFITIWEASWGLNCNDKIADEPNANLARNPIKPVERDNALATISGLCNSRRTCDFKANETTLGTSVAAHCKPELTMMYRCFDIDRPWIIEAKSGDSVKLDCSTH